MEVFSSDWWLPRPSDSRLSASEDDSNSPWCREERSRRRLAGDPSIGTPPAHHDRPGEASRGGGRTTELRN